MNTNLFRYLPEDYYRFKGLSGIKKFYTGKRKTVVKKLGNEELYTLSLDVNSN